MRKLLVMALVLGFILTGCRKDELKDSDFLNSDTNKEQPSDNNKEDNKKNDSDIKSNSDYIKEKEGNENKEVNIDDKSKTKPSVSDDMIIDKIDDVKLFTKEKLPTGIDGLSLIVDGKIIDISDEVGMNASLNLRDLNKDEVLDIVVIEYLGGSGNIQNIYAYLREGNEVIEVLSPSTYINQESFYSEYRGEGDIYFKDDNTDFEVVFNIGKPYENNEQSLEEVKSRFGLGDSAWVDPYLAFSIIDTNNDDIYEIKARQIICGTAHVDIIGEMETIYSLKNDKYIPIEVIYYKYDHNTWKKSEIGRSKVKSQ